ncbi:MAG: LysM peptidoglycan-binding domain-containing protein [Planctomycetes bacterium]|nr:LysM peptidoglycan-binding domain-containing protein [Planctomycetota bacterium]
MTKSRISMIVAAAGLVLVGLLAAVLFTPGDDEPTNESTAQSDEKVTPVEPKSVEMKSVLDYDLDVPKIPTEPSKDAGKTETPKPEVKSEPVKQPEAKGGVIEYKIQPGDMISKLAARYGCKSTDIYKLNEGLNKDTAAKIRVGQTIRIPVGKEGAEAVANAGSSTPKSDGDYYPQRTVTAEAGDTAFSLAIEYYGARNLFRKIIDANPELPWSDRLKGGEQVMLPEHGAAPSTASKESKPADDTVERTSLIPPRK